MSDTKRHGLKVTILPPGWRVADRRSVIVSGEVIGEAVILRGRWGAADRYGFHPNDRGRQLGCRNITGIRNTRQLRLRIHNMIRGVN